MRHNPGWTVRVAAFSPDGRIVATGSYPSGRVAGEVRIWDAATGVLRCPPIPHTNYVSALAFRPDGKVLAAGDYNGLVRFWDTATGKEIGRPLRQGEIVLSLAYSPDGTILAVGLAGDRTGKPGSRLWDLKSGEPIGELLPSSVSVSCLEFRPDGLALLVRSFESNTQLWDTTSGRAIGGPILDERPAGFRPDGLAFLTLGGSGAVKLRDGTTGEVISTLLSLSSPPTCAAFLGDSGLIAVGCEDGTVRLCDPATSQSVGPPRTMRHAVQAVAMSSDGRSVVAIDESGECRTWRIPVPLEDSSLDDLTLRIEARTGLRRESSLSISSLDSATWRQRLEELRRLDPAALQPEKDPAWHEPMIREAERNGNAFAALWHLDRLIAARPHDWHLYARRAKAESASGNLERAAADFQQAERLGSREQVLDLQVHCVNACTKAERWSEALWYLDRLIAGRPDDATLREDRAAVYGKLGREADRQAELARVFELGADEGLVVPRARELGEAGRWAEAARLLARCGRMGPQSQELAQAWAIACLRAGDRAGYREACAAFLACQGPEPTVVWNALSLASLLALGPGGQDDYRPPMACFEKRLTDRAKLPALSRCYFPNALGGLLLRAGRIDEAISRLNESMAVADEARLEELPTNWVYLALAYARKGDRVQARHWLERLSAWHPNSLATFWDLQELGLLRSEAEALINDAGFPTNPFARLDR
jgi:Flp pilus assembly protein TadD